MNKRTYIHIKSWPKRQPNHNRSKVLSFIQSELDKGRPFPSLERIRDYMGWMHASSASDCLDGLVSDGQLVHAGRTEDRKSRRWELAP